MKKVLLLLLFLGISLLSACQKTKTETIDYESKYGSNFKVENMTANQKYLYGMGHIAWSNYMWAGIDYKETTKLMQNMGVKSVRNWMHCDWLMDSPTKYNEKNLAVARSIVDDLLQYDYQIIGMNHSNFHATGYPNSGSGVAKPSRNLAEDSDYMKWLEDYKTTWYHIVKAFPEIMYWEIDNEPNIDVFFSRLEGGSFTLKEKALIYYDMMYFASLGIHEANPEANTVMGGLVIATAETFLQYIYDAIYADDSWSQYPDDYFQVAAWHPYMDDFTPTKFAKTNKDIYNVIKENEGKDKKVFFTEFGFSEGNVALNKINEYIPQAYQVMKDELPFVESSHYFRFYDELGSSWGSTAEKYCGLYSDPTNPGKLTDSGEYENPIFCKPKITAYTYQQMAGGSGSLTLYQDILNAKSE